MSEERNFRSVPELVTSIKDYIGKHNENPKTFIWTAKALQYPGEGKESMRVSSEWVKRVTQNIGRIDGLLQHPTANQGYRNLGHQLLGVIEPDADTVIYDEQKDI